MSEQTLSLADQLEDLLEEENALLRASKYPAAAALAGRKEELMNALNAAVVKTPDVMVDDDFNAQGLRLHTLIKDNKELLETALRIQIKIIQLVANIPTTTSVIYTRTGAPMQLHQHLGRTLSLQA
jgi:flagellar biosynthesis/type III secretory pathway chaperone